MRLRFTEADVLLPTEITTQGQVIKKYKTCSLNGTLTSNPVESIRLSVITKSPPSSRPLQTNYFTLVLSLQPQHRVYNVVWPRPTQDVRTTH